MIQGVSEYGINENGAFLSKLKKSTKAKWFDQFDSKTLSVIKLDQNGDKMLAQGLTLEGLKMIELQSAFMTVEGKKDTSTKLQTILSTF